MKKKNEHNSNKVKTRGKGGGYSKCEENKQQKQCHNSTQAIYDGDAEWQKGFKKKMINSSFCSPSSTTTF